MRGLRTNIHAQLPCSCCNPNLRVTFYTGEIGPTVLQIVFAAGKPRNSPAIANLVMGSYNLGPDAKHVKLNTAKLRLATSGAGRSHLGQGSMKNKKQA